MHLTRTMFSKDERFPVGNSIGVIFAMVETFWVQKAVGIFPRLPKFQGATFTGSFLGAVLYRRSLD